MTHSLARPAALAALAATASLSLVAAPAQAATGGTPTTTNPGLVTLHNADGDQVCSATLVSKSVALTWKSGCEGAVTARVPGAAGEVKITDQKQPPFRHPGKTQARAFVFEKALDGLNPAQLSDHKMKAGDVVTVTALADGKLVTGQVSITGVGGPDDHRWLSYADDLPDGFGLDARRDTGVPVTVDGALVGFSILQGSDDMNMENIDHLRGWISDLTR